MSFYEYKIVVEISAIAWCELPNVKLQEITQVFEDKKILLGSSSMKTEKVGIIKPIKND